MDPSPVRTGSSSPTNPPASVGRGPLPVGPSASGVWPLPVGPSDSRGRRVSGTRADHPLPPNSYRTLWSSLQFRSQPEYSAGGSFPPEVSQQRPSTTVELAGNQEVSGRQEATAKGRRLCAEDVGDLSEPLQSECRQQQWFPAATTSSGSPGTQAMDSSLAQPWRGEVEAGGSLLRVEVTEQLQVASASAQVATGSHREKQPVTDDLSEVDGTVQGGDVDNDNLPLEAAAV